MTTKGGSYILTLNSLRLLEGQGKIVFFYAVTFLVSFPSIREDIRPSNRFGVIFTSFSEKELVGEDKAKNVVLIFDCFDF